MEFIHAITNIDTNVFLFLNGLHNSFFDSLMWLISARLTWVPLYISILYLAVKNWGKNALWVIVALVLCAALSDYISSGLIKNWVARPRPSREGSLEGIVHIVNGYHGGHYGFVSSHAANTFSVALFCLLIFRNRTLNCIMLSWTFLNVYSRIYLGVHYPLDIIGGMLVGGLVATALYALLRKLRPQIALLVLHRKINGFAVLYWVFGTTMATLILMSVF
ncbi:MAG: phosphatase PAP2 family protein [Prevotellaceae bacterium]|jgi:undecaprenyl-diphosphatase|nr:phosphatase PAP2 family protein [Prevotellaceae bacterium]